VLVREFGYLRFLFYYAFSTAGSTTSFSTTAINIDPLKGLFVLRQSTHAQQKHRTIIRNVVLVE
jgi:hypothetical protein